MSKSNRNEPCTCGSMLKFKKCCGTAKRQKELRDEQIARWQEEANERARVRRKEYAKNTGRTASLAAAIAGAMTLSYENYRK